MSLIIQLWKLELVFLGKLEKRIGHLVKELWPTNLLPIAQVQFLSFWGDRVGERRGKRLERSQFRHFDLLNDALPRVA